MPQASYRFEFPELATLFHCKWAHACNSRAVQVRETVEGKGSHANILQVWGIVDRARVVR